MRTLAYVFSEKWELLEGDFQRYYQMDLRVEAARAGCRRLHALVMALPPEAAIHRSDRLAPGEEFLACLVENQQAWMDVHLQVLMGAKKVSKPHRVEIIRPGDTPSRRVENDPAEISRFFKTHHVAG